MRGQWEHGRSTELKIVRKFGSRTDSVTLKLLLRHMHNLEIFVQSHQFTKPDGEPI